MAFQLFVQPHAGEILGEAIGSAATGVSNAMAAQKQTDIDAANYDRAMDALQKAFPDNQLFQVDRRGMSSYQKAQAHAQLGQQISQFAALQNANAADALKKTQNDILNLQKTLLQKQMGVEGQDISTPAVQAMVAKDGAVAKQRQDIQNAGYGEDYQKYLSAARLIQEGHKSTQDFIAKQAQQQLSNKDIPWWSVQAPFNAVSQVPGAISEAFSGKKTFPDMPKGYDDAVKILSSLNSDPAKRAAYAPLLQKDLNPNYFTPKQVNQQTATPQITSETLNENGVSIRVKP